MNTCLPPSRLILVFIFILCRNTLCIVAWFFGLNRAARAGSMSSLFWQESRGEISILYVTNLCKIRYSNTLQHQNRVSATPRLFLLSTTFFGKFCVMTFELCANLSQISKLHEILLCLYACFTEIAYASDNAALFIQYFD